MKQWLISKNKKNSIKKDSLISQFILNNLFPFFCTQVREQSIMSNNPFYVFYKYIALARRCSRGFIRIFGEWNVRIWTNKSYRIYKIHRISGIGIHMIRLKPSVFLFWRLGDTGRNMNIIRYLFFYKSYFTGWICIVHLYICTVSVFRGVHLRGGGGGFKFFW